MGHKGWFVGCGSVRRRGAPVPCVSPRRGGGGRALAPLLALLPLLLWAVPLGAQETIDPRSGRLVLTITDLAVPAGPVPLEVQRSLGAPPNKRGLLGSRWRLNWESRLVRSGPRVLLDEAGGTVPFEADKSKGGYKTGAGERLVFDKQQQALRTKPDGTQERFDAQGRLVARDYRNGNTVALQYGADGRLAQINGPKGSFLRLTADPEGRVLQVDASTGATVQYTYAREALTEARVNGGPALRYTYDAQGALVRLDDPQAGTVELAYDTKGRVVSRRWADGSQERFAYDDATNLQRRIDAAGGSTTSQWSPDGRQVEITDPLGHKSVIAYDDAGHPLAVTDPTGATSRLTYDALGRMVAVENALGQLTRVEYLGESAQIKTVIRPDGTRQDWEYDGQGNLTAVKLGETTVATLTYHPDGSVATAWEYGAPEQQFAYHPDGRLQAVANPLGETTHFEYDPRGNLLRETNPLGGVTLGSYDSQDRLVSLTDAAGATSRYEYDAGGRLSRSIDPAGGMTRYEYDARGRLQAETDPAGQVTRYEYDALGHLVKVIGPGNAVESFRYDASGNLTEQTDHLGRTTQLAYDALGQRTRERSPTGLDVRYRHDRLGHLVGLEATRGAKSEFRRDADGRLTAVVDPLGAVTQLLYDPLGNLIALIDPRSQVKAFTYDAAGLLHRVEEPSGDAAHYEYDSAARPVAIQHPGGGLTRLAYDSLGNLLSRTDPLGHQVHHSYNPAGRRVSTTDAAGRLTRYMYDQPGRMVEKHLPDGQRVTYQYDQLSNMLQADDGVFPIKFSYDAAGQLMRVAYPAIQQAVGYEYDALGLRTKLIDPQGRETRYEYNALKQLAAIVLPDGQRFALTYDNQERLQSMRYPNGITGRWEYDVADRITQVSYQDPTGKAIAGWTYRFDPTGNPVEHLDHQGQSVRFQYDAVGRLTEEAGAHGTRRYRYLPGGNRDSLEAGEAVLQYQYDAGDRLLQAGQEQLTYDANGHLTQRQGPGGTTVYAYDAEGRLVKVVWLHGATTTFGYAPTGERVWKRDQDGLTYYLYDGFDLLQELDEKGTLKAAYVHGLGLDRPLAMWRDGQRYYYHADQLGSIRLLTDEQGQVVTSYDYDAFGRLTAPSTAVTNPFTFTAREFDAGIGLYYYRARYYDAQLGRFLSPDPVDGTLADVAALNRYAYVRNTPTRYRDPLGLMDDQGVLNWAADWIQAANRIGESNLTPRQKDALDLARTIISTNSTHASGKAAQRFWDAGKPIPPIKWSNLSNAIRTLPKPPQTGQMRVPGPDRHVDPKAPTVAVRVAPSSGPPSGSGKISRSGAGLGPIATPVKIIFIGRSASNIAQAWDTPDSAHVNATEAGGWIGGLGGPAVVGYLCGSVGGPLGSLAVGAASSYLCSKLGGWLWPRGQTPPDKLPPPPPPERTPAPPPPRGTAEGPDRPKDPGMGDKPPDLAGAAQAGAQRTGAGRPPGSKGDKGSLGTDQAIDQQAYRDPPQSVEPTSPTTPPEPSRTMCRDQQGNPVPCDWLYHDPRSRGRPLEGKEDSVQVPWGGLAPGGQPQRGGTGPCPPGCHPRPDGKGCHCPQTPKSAAKPPAAPSTLAQQPPAAPKAQLYDCNEMCLKLCTGTPDLSGRPKDCKALCAGQTGKGRDADDCYWQSPEGQRYKKEHGMK